MEKQNNTTGKTVLIVLLLIVTIVSLVLATYAWAKYTSSFEDKTATAQVAKWKVSANTADLTFSKTIEHVVAPNKLAPGTNGTFSATLDVTGTEVDVDYTVTIKSIENKPTNLKLTDDEGNTLTVGSTITGTLPVGSTTATEVITWDWPYETPDGDATDTTDGVAANTMKITYDITAVQVKPE